MELSVYHNVIVTTSNSNLVYLWDYEYFKLIKCLELQKNEEPTCISFINGYAILLIGTNNNKIYLQHFEFRDQNITLKLICIIDIESIFLNNELNLEFDKEELKGKITPNRMMVDLNYNSSGTKPQECNL